MKYISCYFALLTVLAGAVTAGCASTTESVGQPSQAIAIDGSSTVYPITSAIAEQYALTEENRNVPVEVTFSGTGDGFAKFCAGETVVSNASRPVSKAEMQTCSDAQIRYFELPVAFDAITVVVHPQNTWAAQENSALQEFVNFYLENASATVTEVGYMPLPEEGYEIALTQFYRGKVGTVFDGQMPPDLTIGELLTKRATF